MVKEEIERHFGVPDSILHVIYSGVDIQSFHPDIKQRHRSALRAELGIAADATVFLFVGSGFERKGLAATLQAMTLLPPHTYLLVVGKDKKREKFKALACKSGLGRRVRFLGGQKDVKPFYGAADALVLPTLYDPFPNAALEAMAVGLPVITSEKSGAAEFIRPGENGYVCDALDIPALANHMQQLLAHDACEKLGRAARVSVEPYDLEGMGERLLALYESLLHPV